jgi:hypothetical protein
MRIKNLNENKPRTQAFGYNGNRLHIFQKKTPHGQKMELLIPPKTPGVGSIVRIKSITPTCQYIKYARYIVGRQMKLNRKTGGMPGSTTGWYEFVHDEDRKALNHAAGWSDAKFEYLFENPKLK